ncbi:MAG TPA: hypothetical protein VIY73_26765 [Polyangiaceae bacterium]
MLRTAAPSALIALLAPSLAAVAGFVGLATLAACSRHEPPAPATSPSVALPELASPSPSGAPASSTLPASPSTPSTQHPALGASTADASASTAPTGSADPATLPQTHDRPVASGAAWDARVAALWKAIVADDPDQAMPFFFPLGAYEQVKDIGNPASDWKHRLVAAYAHDIHALHAHLGDSASSATLVGLDLPDARARWVDPGEEYNKIGYYRVFGSRLRYTVDGEAHSFDVKSLISWRGEWFVVHLSAIK